MVKTALLLAAVVLLTTGECTRRHSTPHGEPEVDTRSSPEVSIFFTADVGNGRASLSRRATLVDRVRVEVGQGSVVQVDAGDFLSGLGSLDDRVRRARLRLAAYARMGVDALTVGEGDLDIGPDRFLRLTAAYGVPVVAANVVKNSGEHVFPATRLIRTPQANVGIFGILELPEQPEHWADWELKTGDPVVEARAAVAALHAQGASLVVGLFHVAGGPARAVQIARRAGRVDLIVLGHAEGRTDVDIMPRRRLPAIVQASSLSSGSDGAGASGAGSLGRVDVFARGRGFSFRARSLALTPQTPDQLGVGLLESVDANPSAVYSPQVQAVPGARLENWTYASTEACSYCHKTELSQWQGTPHAHAYATLQESGHAKDIACLGCHMTGFLRPGGTKYIDIAIEQLSDVGCESCHGPSVAHVMSMDKSKGTSLRVAGEVCLGCHTPDQSVEPFDLVRALPRIVGPGHGQPAHP